MTWKAVCNLYGLTESDVKKTVYKYCNYCNKKAIQTCSMRKIKQGSHVDARVYGAPPTALSENLRQKQI